MRQADVGHPERWQRFPTTRPLRRPAAALPVMDSDPTAKLPETPDFPFFYLCASKQRRRFQISGVPRSRQGRDGS
jgi:hypothetical protein